MKTYLETTISRKPLLQISYDESDISPRDNDGNLGYFITQDSRYYSPDTNAELQRIIREAGEQVQSLREHIALIKKEYTGTAFEKKEKVIAVYPVVKYEHSGVSYRLGEAHGFDYSNNGFYVITDKTQAEVGVKTKDFEKVISAELETFTSYANGEVYQFILYNKKGEIKDSCGGFYNIEDIKEYLPKSWQKADLRDYLVD